MIKLPDVTPADTAVRVHKPAAANPPPVQFAPMDDAEVPQIRAQLAPGAAIRVQEVPEIEPASAAQPGAAGALSSPSDDRFAAVEQQLRDLVLRFTAILGTTERQQSQLAALQHDIASSLVQAAMEIRGERDAAERWRKAAEAQLSALATDAAEARAEQSRRAAAVDAALAAKGLAVAETPTLVLRQPAARRIARAPEVQGGEVVIFYSPRGGDGSGYQDDAEFRVPPGGEKRVHSGFVVDVPPGHVADVVVSGEVVESRSGRGEVEMAVTVRGRASYRHVGAGHELCRLSLRRCVPVGLRVEVAGR